MESEIHSIREKKSGEQQLETRAFLNKKEILLFISKNQLIPYKTKLIFTFTHKLSDYIVYF